MKPELATILLILHQTLAKHLRISNGYDAKRGQYPYIVALCANSTSQVQRLCTGSLITSTWGLTAGHCLTSFTRRIRYGDMTVPPLDDRAQYSHIRRQIRHPDYTHKRISALQKLQIQVKNDIGLMFVAPVKLNRYGRLSAADYSSFMGYRVNYAGFGRTFSGKAGVKNFAKKVAEDDRRRLQIAEAVVKKCSGKDGNVFSPFLCAAPKCEDKSSAQQGDSGSPMIHSGQIVGVLYGGKSYESFFTPVSLYIDWMARVMEPK